MRQPPKLLPPPTPTDMPPLTTAANGLTFKAQFVCFHRTLEHWSILECGHDHWFVPIFVFFQHPDVAAQQRSKVWPPRECCHSEFKEVNASTQVPPHQKKCLGISLWQWGRDRKLEIWLQKAKTAAAITVHWGVAYVCVGGGGVKPKVVSSQKPLQCQSFFAPFSSSEVMVSKSFCVAFVKVVVQNEVHSNTK